MPIRPTRADADLPQIPPRGPERIKGRGTAWALAHRFSRDEREPWDDGWGTLDADSAARASAPPPATEVIEQPARSALVANESPDIHFDLSINPYRGCEHGCVYCFARPTHSYLNLSPGLDFETRIIAKTGLAATLRAELSRPSYQPRTLNIGSATDAYQPVERRLRITREVLEVLSACGHPLSIITKSAAVERDLDLLAPMAVLGQAAVYVSIATLDAGLARQLEPRAASPARRLQCIERLSAAGVPVGVSVSPMIPFITEPDLEAVLEAAAAAGARVAFSTVLRLPWEVDPLFRQWLQAHHPARAERVMARVQEMRGGRDNDPRFGTRMHGEGIWAELLRQRFLLACRRAGLGTHRIPLDFSRFAVPPAWRHRPADPAQATLF